MHKKLLSLWLVAMMLLSTVACSGSKEDDTTNSDTTNGSESTADTTPEETETSRENTPDSLPADLNFNGQTVSFYYFGIDDCKNYDAIGEETGGDAALSAVHERNLLTEDRLGVKLEWIEGSGEWDGFPADVRTALESNVHDWDVVLEENSRLFQQSVEGWFFDFLALDNSYIDLDQPWWYQALMEESSIDNNKRFFVTGDINMSTKFGASTLFFNKPLFNDNIGNIQELYDLVLNGQWTYDKLMEYCRAIYSDLDGGGEFDVNDRMGFTWETWGAPNYMSMSNGLTYITRDSDGLPVLDLFNEDSIRWGETFYRLLFTDNMSYAHGGGQADSVNYFISGNKLFLFSQLSKALLLRDVSFEYGILPYPKLNETLDYVSGAATANGTGVGIPISTPSDVIPGITATVEALCAQSYRTVVPAFYESAMRFKYLDTEVDAQMLDIITDHISSPFIMMADKLLTTGSIFTYAVVLGESNEGAFSSYYESNRSSIEANWAEMIESYQNAGLN